jgi:hypothetical protein
MKKGEDLVIVYHSAHIHTQRCSTRCNKYFSICAVCTCVCLHLHTQSHTRTTRMHAHHIHMRACIKTFGHSDSLCVGFYFWFKTCTHCDKIFVYNALF